MLKIAVLAVALTAAALIVTARHHSTPISSASAAPTDTTETTDDICHFKEGNGVRLGKSAWKFIKPATTEVQTIEVAPDLKAEVRVYIAATDSTRQALASATVPAGTAFAPGDAVQLSTTTGEPAEWQGQVTRIDRQMEPVSGQVEAIIEVTDPDKKLTAGAFLTMRVVSAKAKKVSVPVAPWSAVVQSSKGAFVYAVNGEYFLRTPVKLGARHDDQVEIVDGLFEGDKVASKSANALWMVELQATNGGKSCCAAGH